MSFLSKYTDYLLFLTRKLFRSTIAQSTNFTIIDYGRSNKKMIT